MIRTIFAVNKRQSTCQDCLPNMSFQRWTVYGCPRPRPRSEPLSRQALHTLRQAILAGRMAPGERLVEERLSAELGMSRVPIREAIKQLAGRGAGGAGRAAGAWRRRSPTVSEEFARDLIEVRAVLEGLTARLAARHCDGAARAAIQALLARGGALASRGAEAELAQLNAAFHELLAAAGANQALGEVMRPLRERTELVFRRNTTERAGPDWREHAMILEAVSEGDEELAALLADRHVRRAARSI